MASLLVLLLVVRAAACVLALCRFSGASVTVTCNGGACAPDWYKIDVCSRISWDNRSVDHRTPGCGYTDVSSDTSAVALHVSFGLRRTPPRRHRITIKKDATPPTVTGGSPTRGPDSNGWYNHPVGINFNGSDATSGLAGCNSTTYGGPDSGGASFSGVCTDNAGNTSGPASFGPIKYDATPPSVSAALSRGPDSGNWYNHPVSFQAAGSDNLSGIASVHVGDDRWRRTSRRDLHGQRGQCRERRRGSELRLERALHRQRHVRPSTRQQWLVQPSGPRYVPWQRRWLRLSSCSDSMYAGPDTASTTVNGTWQRTTRATVPAARRRRSSTTRRRHDRQRRVRLGRRHATLTWSASADTKAIEIDRTPGTAGADPSAVFKGLGSSFEDTGLTNKVKYVYTITGFDEAGNKASDTVSIIPGAKLYSPARGSSLVNPPLLAWRPVARSLLLQPAGLLRSGQGASPVASLDVSGRRS